MKLVCPDDPTHDKFYISVHVTELWRTDNKGGDFEKVVDNSEVIQRPSIDDLWSCAECGEDADVTDVTNERVFNVTVYSLITESKVTRVTAKSADEARKLVENKLEGGWSEVFGDSDGDLVDVDNFIECVDEVTDV